MRMTAADRYRAACGVAGLAALGPLFVARAVATATTRAVTFAGHELHWECAFRQAFGIPCPTCGMTRSVLLTLHGHVSEALGLNPGGPLLILGALLFAAAMFYVALRRREPGSGASIEAWFEMSPRRFAVGAAAYGGMLTAVLMTHWLRAIL